MTREQMAVPGDRGSPAYAGRGCLLGLQLAPPAAMNASTLVGSIRRAPDTRTCRSCPRLQRAYTVAVETASRSATSRTESRRVPVVPEEEKGRNHQGRN